MTKNKKFKSLKEEVKYLDEVLNETSKYGNFKVKDEPFYHMLKRDVEYHGKVVNKLEHRLSNAKLLLMFYETELFCMCKGVDFDIEAFNEIQCDFENLQFKEY